MLNNSLIQFSLDGWNCVPSLLLIWGQSMVKVMKIMEASFKRSRAHPQPCRRPLLTHASSRDAWTLIGKSGSVSCGVTAPFSWVMVHKVLLRPPRVYFPVLCKFWQLYDGVNGDFLQEGLCHTQVCCTQSPCPHSSPLLTNRRCSKKVLSQSLWGLWVVVCTRFV